MTSEGVDFSSGRPGATALVAAGKSFVCRYLPYQFGTTTAGAKALTAAEISEYRGHGLSIVLNFEWFAGRMRSGAAAGTADASQSVAAFTKLGIPSSLPVYFSADFDTTAADYPATDAYLKAAAVVLGSVERVGVYGEAALIAHCRQYGTARWFWQTYAWSGGTVSPYAHLYQYRNGQTLNGAAVDLDRAFVANYGQWLPPLPDSSTGDPVGLNLDFSVTHDTNPFDALGTASIVGDGHYAIRIADGVGTKIAGGTSLGVVQKCVVVDALGSSFAAGEAAVAYNLNGAGYASPVRDIGTTFKALTAPATDCTAAVKAATDPLNATITDLRVQVAAAATAERGRIAAAEADRIKAI